MEIKMKINVVTYYYGKLLLKKFCPIDWFMPYAVWVMFNFTSNVEIWRWRRLNFTENNQFYWKIEGTRERPLMLPYIYQQLNTSNISHSQNINQISPFLDKYLRHASFFLHKNKLFLTFQVMVRKQIIWWTGDFNSFQCCLFLVNL